MCQQQSSDQPELEIISVKVEAKSRLLNTYYSEKKLSRNIDRSSSRFVKNPPPDPFIYDTAVTQYDNSLDIEAELTKVIAAEMAKECDAEILRSIQGL